jgi:hypothetical protein
MLQAIIGEWGVRHEVIENQLVELGGRVEENWHDGSVVDDA